MYKIAVLIPCFNEEKTVQSVVLEYRKALPESEIYVYDNNSTDNTAALAKEVNAIVVQEPKQGKGNVIRSMFRDIDADCYVMVDGDATYPADKVREMCDMVLYKKMDMVIGDRLSSTYYEENKRRFHNFGNNIVRNAINTLFHSNVKDVMTGSRAFSRRFVKSYPVLSKGFEIETEMTIHALFRNMNIASIPVPYLDRPDGSESKLNTYKDGLKVLFTIVKLYKNYKPLYFFSFLACVLSVLSIGFFIPIFIDFLNTGMVEKIPTLVVCGFTFLTAVLMEFCGLILETIVHKDRQQYELYLNQI